MRELFLLLLNNTMTASIVILATMLARLLLGKVSRKYCYWPWMVV